jgi:putative membrane protein
MNATLGGSGLLVLLLAWSSVPRAFTPGAFSAHMVTHIAVVAVAAPLFAAAVAGRRFDPVPRRPHWFAVIAASFVELLLVWIWHTPALHHVARVSWSGAVAEQASFLVAGVYLWMAAAGGTGTLGRARAAAGVGALLFTSMHMTLLGALFALTPRVLYAEHATGPAALMDQHLGGVIMLLVGGGSYLAGGLWLTLRALRDETPQAGGNDMKGLS